MLSDAVKRLREDKRLYRRSDWISNEELAAQLDSLPDVSQKCAIEDESNAGEGAASANPS